MRELKQGSASIVLPDHMEMPERAGSLTVKEVRRFGRARQGVGLTARRTAEAMTKNPGRVAVLGVEPARLTERGRRAEEIDALIIDLEAMLVVLKQATTLIGFEAHEDLRRVLAAVRAQEKFDPQLALLFPDLVAYFAHSRKAPRPAPQD